MDDCVEWQGYRNAAGYGQTPGRPGTRRAHRVAWIEAYGPIPDDLCVLHRCDNPPCINIDHLFLGTRGDNNRDRVAKGRTRHRNTGKPYCIHGHPLSGDNLYVQPATGKRYCRTCALDAKRRWRRKKANA